MIYLACTEILYYDVDMYRKFSPAKVRALRGSRTRKELLANINGVIGETELAAYESPKEKGGYRPSDIKMLHLLKALDCGYDDISEPITLESVATVQ